MSTEQDRAESIRHRLRNRLRERGEDIRFGLQRYAVERFLYRLGESPHRDRFILKGAALFALWGGAVYRSTRDLDFTCYGSPDEAAIVAALREVCQHQCPGDEVRFDTTAPVVKPIRDESEYVGFRLTFEATLGSSRIPVQIDVGFGNAIEPPPVAVEYPTSLGHTAPRILAYQKESTVAEKLHAMTVLGERNSRFKDFYDLHALAQYFPFDGESLARAIAATFTRRSTRIDSALPAALTPRFYIDDGRARQWRIYLTRNALPATPAEFEAVGEVLGSFLRPIWIALADKGAIPSRWPRGGPWEAAS